MVATDYKLYLDRLAFPLVIKGNSTHDGITISYQSGRNGVHLRSQNSLQMEYLRYVLYAANREDHILYHWCSSQVY